MVSLQIISKIINNADYSIIEDNALTNEQFVGYEKEIAYIKEHYKTYGNVPDKATFLSAFPDITLVEVTESNKYLIDTLREENLYYQSIPVVQKVADLLKTDANSAVEYMLSAVKTLQPNYNLGGIDIVKDITRLEEFKERRDNPQSWYFTTGFKELDDIMYGFRRGEELVVMYARINQGKSWISEKITEHIWGMGFNVGYVSPEMSATSIGYRFDTLHSHFSNRALMNGSKELNEEEYANYLNQLTAKDNKFVVATPLDFDKKITVTKLRNWIKQNNLDFIAIDGITYLSDEGAKTGDKKNITLTNISEDLMTLSMEMQIPILVVVQANREGVNKDNDNTPDLDNISDSDGIGRLASKALALRQLADKTLKITIKKNRWGPAGDSVHYDWDIDTGDFTYKKVPADVDSIPEQPRVRSEKEGVDLF